MEDKDLLRYAVEALERLGLRYLVTGSIATIHPSSGLKIDIMIPAGTLFDRSRFERAHRVRPEPDFEASFASSEDVIVKKLEYYREGGSEKHLRDITGVLRISGEKIDHSYIQEWAERLGLEDIWQVILERLESARPDPRAV